MDTTSGSTRSATCAASLALCPRIPICSTTPCVVTCYWRGQRPAIARALLKDAPLLVLDEATANLDPMTEHTLLDALDMLMQGRTTLVITHRLVRMERMDEILVLDEGSIRERGTHEQLLRSGGLYQQMVQLQEGILSLT